MPGCDCTRRKRTLGWGCEWTWRLHLHTFKKGCNYTKYTFLGPRSIIQKDMQPIANRYPVSLLLEHSEWRLKDNMWPARSKRSAQNFEVKAWQTWQTCSKLRGTWAPQCQKSPSLRKQTDFPPVALRRYFLAAQSNSWKIRLFSLARVFLTSSCLFICLFVSPSALISKNHRMHSTSSLLLELEK